MAEATVQMRGIRKQFPSCLANDNVDFTAYRGEIHALLGENGAGKSTMIKCMARLLKPTEGVIFMDRCALTEMEANALSGIRPSIGRYDISSDRRNVGRFGAKNLCLCMLVIGQEGSRKD